ncbi:MAG: hypothetical protein ACOX0L_05600 [Natronincolaceae bacterium]|jgi:hypothetical protein
MCKPIAGARESNAGDDFHLVWAAKKALALLEPNTNFKALSVEGPSLEDERNFEIDSKDLLSIDVAEYYGDKTFETASNVIFSQLKYSTRNANKDWTLANLCTPTNKKKDNSIIRRLAQTYDGYDKRYSNLESKLVLKLVSNKKIEVDLIQLFNTCKEAITKEDIVQYVQLKGSLKSQSEKDMLKRLYSETKLESKKFIGFLLCLDFSDCGASIREIQSSEVIQKLRLWGNTDLKSDYNNLIMFINKQMTPEAANLGPIDKYSVLGILSQTEDLMFPARSHIFHVKDYVERDITSKIIEKIINGRNQYLSLHSSGGMGKTTVINNLENKLPKGSVVLTYDCYGGGGYLDPSTPRHTYKKAIYQLCNDLALRCSTPFLLGRGLDNSELLEQFSIRINEAIKVIQDYNPKAFLIIVLDALDNSYEASILNNDENFADKLLKIKIPENTSFLVTARTERLENLNLPNNFEHLKLEGFSVKEQKQYIRKFSPDITDSKCEEFRSLSYGNPRVQFYILQKSNYDIDNAIEFLKPNGKKLDGIFEEVFNKSTHLSESELSNFERLCSILVIMPRPIPIELVLEVSGYTREMLNSACSEYLLGIYINEENISFRDEDFEVYLRSVSKKDIYTENRIAEFMYNNRLSNDYCMRYLHIFLSRTSRFKDLTSTIFIKEEILVPITQEEKNEIILERIKYACKMQEALEPQYRVETLQMLYISTKCKSTDSSFRSLIRQDINITSKYCTQSTVSRYFSVKDQSSFNISTLSENTAALLLNNNNNKRANEYFELALVAIRKYFDADKEERWRMHDGPKDKDITYLATFIAIEKSTKAATKWLSSWTPYPIQEYYDLIYSLLIYNYDELACKILLDAQNVDVFAACILAYKDCLRIVPESAWILLERLLNKIDSEKYKVQEKDFKYRISLAEDLIGRGKLGQAETIVNNTEIEQDYSYISFHTFNGELPMEYCFKLYALKKFFKEEDYDSEDFWNPESSRYKNSTDEKINEEKSKQKRILNHIMPSFFSRLKAISEDLSSENLLKLFKNEYNNCKNIQYSFYNDHNSYDYYRCICTNICELLIYSGKLDKFVIKEQCNKLLDDKYLNNSFYFILVRMLMGNRQYVDIAITILYELEEHTLNIPQASYEISEFYLECSKICTIIDEELGKEFFTKAVEISTGIDEDAYHRFELYFAAAEDNQDFVDSEQLEYNLTRIIEDGYTRLNDGKHFPSKKAFQTLAHVNPNGAIASACRWDDRDHDNIFNFEETIPNIIFVLLKNDLISPGLAVALSNIDIKNGVNYSNIIKMVLEKLESSSKQDSIKVLEIICYDISKLSSGFANGNIISMIVQWCEVNGFKELLCVQKLKESYAYINNSLNDGLEKRYNRDKDDNYISWDSIDKRTIKLTEENLNYYIENINYEDTVQMIKYFFDRCDYVDQENCINIFVRLFYSGNGRWDKQEHLDTLVYYLNQWSKTNPKIRSWREDENNIDKVILWYKGKNSHFKLENTIYLKRIFTVNQEVIINKLLEDISMLLESDSWQMFSYIEAILRLEEDNKKASFLEWCTNEEIQDVHKESSDKEYDIENSTYPELIKSLAIYLWKMLGHVEKENRWYATHTVYNLYKLGEYGIIYNLLGVVNISFPSIYKDQKAYVFRETSIVQLFIAIKRIVVENPEPFKRYYEFFKKIALTSNTINILTRELAKEIALRLSTEEDENLIKCCDVVTSTKIKYNWKALNQKNQNIEYEFYFDRMDMLPYVYSRLGEIFMKSESDVALSCQSYINKFNINNDIVSEWENKFRKSKYHDKTYGLDSPIELIDKYAQLNAMYYVADEYRKTLPISDEEYPIYTFNEWVHSNLTCFDEKWISDLKDIPPQIPQFLDTALYLDEEDKSYIVSDNYFKNIYEFNYNGKEHLILYASNRIESDHRIKNIQISTGFIKKDRLENLKERLKEENFRLGYYYLDENNEFADNLSDSFIQQAIDSIGINDSSCEKYDPYNCEIGLRLLQPSKTIENFIGTSGVHPISYCTNEMDRHPVKTQYWCYSKNGGQMYNFSCNGSMIFIEKETLKKYIESKETVLLVNQVTIEFKDGYYRHLSPEYKSNERSIVYIFNKDTVENYEIKLKKYW